jgi:hypothetical protein
VKAIGSKKTTGPEAILMVAVQYWATGTNLQSRIKTHIERSDHNFSSRQEHVLSARLAASGFPMERLVQHFWETCKRNHTLKFAIETAVLACKREGRTDWAKEFVKSHIISLCGAMAKGIKNAKV